LLIIADSLAASVGQVFPQVGVDVDVARLKEAERKHPRLSEFGMGLSGYAWCYGMEVWAPWAWSLMLLNPQYIKQF
jgi:hypothetical protein